MTITDVTSMQAPRSLLTAAQMQVAQALKSGSCEDPRALEESAIRFLTLGIDKSAQVMLCADTAFFFYVSGRSDRGLALATEARKASIEIADENLLASCLSLVGICAADTGNLPLAMEAYSEALSLAQNGSLKVREGKVWLNLGGALVYAGLYREAIGCYSKGLQICKSERELESFVPSLYSNIALCYLNLEEVQQGLLAIRKATEIVGEPTDASSLHNRVLTENYYTRLLIEVDDFVGARQHAEAAVQYASRSKVPRSDVVAKVAMGLVEVFSGFADTGITRLTETLNRAKTLKVPTREVLIALVRAHEFLGQHDQALEYLKNMLDQQRTTQEANVLTHVRLHLEQLHGEADRPPIEDSKQVIKRLETRAELMEGRVAKIELVQQRQEQFLERVEMLERMAVTAELRDDSTGEHSYRVGRLAGLLALELGFNQEKVFMIDVAARLHDIGKIGIPDGILLKPRAFNAAEREIMETHTIIGAEVLAKSNVPQIKMAEEIARHHHEHWNGKGYPAGLSGENIPDHARITALADVFDALTHKRPYKEAWTVDAALTEILSLRGSHFDPHFTDVFLGLVSRLRRDVADLDAFLGAEARKTSFHIARGKVWDNLKLKREEYLAIGLRFDSQR
jgi:putative two-component system response regulator